MEKQDRIKQTGGLWDCTEDCMIIQWCKEEGRYNPGGKCNFSLAKFFAYDCMYRNMEERSPHSLIG